MIHRLILIHPFPLPKALEELFLINKNIQPPLRPSFERRDYMSQFIKFKPVETEKELKNITGFFKFLPLRRGELRGVGWKMDIGWIIFELFRSLFMTDALLRYILFMNLYLTRWEAEPQRCVQPQSPPTHEASAGQAAERSIFLLYWSDFFAQNKITKTTLTSSRSALSRDPQWNARSFDFDNVKYN